MRHILGIDIGTSGTKTILCDERGTILAEAVAEYPCYAPRPGWSEQDPADWWDAVVKTVQQVLRHAKLSGSQVCAIGLSGQMHGLVCLDKKGTVLRRAILWNDQRTAAQCDEITQRAGGAKKLLALVANPALTGFTAPKILWVRQHEPRIYAKTAMLLLPKDYIRYRLSGAFATEVSDASGTLLLDVKNRRWSKTLLRKLAIDRTLLPPVFESPIASTVVNQAAADTLGIAVNTPIAGGGGDQEAVAVGNGIVKRGVISAMLGTSGVVFAHADTVEADPHGRVHTFCHAVPGKWHTMGVVLAAGGSLQWFRNHLCATEIAQAKQQNIDPYSLMTAQAESVQPGCEGLFWLPYLTGERTPHADPNARACFIGLTPRHGKAEMIRAVMEGVTYAMRDSLEIMRGMGIKAKEIRLSGGGAQSACWRQMQADVYKSACSVTDSTAGSAYGAMLLGGVAGGVWQSVPAACAVTIKVVSRTRKRAKQARLYDKYFPLYQELYTSLRKNFAAIADTT